MYGTGAQTRSFCYVDDLVKGLILLMESPAAFTGPVNLGNPGEFTMLELASIIKDVSASSSDMVFLELPEDDPKRRRPDISLARQSLSWEPKIPLQEGIKRTVDYFKELISSSKAQSSSQVQSSSKAQSSSQVQTEE
jgi:UDP-glucuronate decarboxylase